MLHLFTWKISDPVALLCHCHLCSLGDWRNMDEGQLQVTWLCRQSLSWAQSRSIIFFKTPMSILKKILYNASPCMTPYSNTPGTCVLSLILLLGFISCSFLSWVPHSLFQFSCFPQFSFFYPIICFFMNPEASPCP